MGTSENNNDIQNILTDAEPSQGEYDILDVPSYVHFPLAVSGKGPSSLCII